MENKNDSDASQNNEQTTVYIEQEQIPNVEDTAIVEYLDTDK